MDMQCPQLCDLIVIMSVPLGGESIQLLGSNMHEEKKPDEHCSLVDCQNRQCLLALPLLAIKVLTLLKLATFGVLVKIHENS